MRLLVTKRAQKNDGPAIFPPWLVDDVCSLDQERSEPSAWSLSCIATARPARFHEMRLIHFGVGSFAESFIKNNVSEMERSARLVNFDLVAHCFFLKSMTVFSQAYSLGLTSFSIDANAVSISLFASSSITKNAIRSSGI